MSERRVVPVTCMQHGVRGFCNLCMTKDGDRIRLDPHVTGGCVIELDETAAIAVRDQITEWLG